MENTFTNTFIDKVVNHNLDVDEIKLLINNKLDTITVNLNQYVNVNYTSLK